MTVAARIMVVEDERIVALHIRQQLEKLGYEVPAVVASGEQALERIDAEQPDLVLMDIRIDGLLDGIETAARIPPQYRIPVIYLTAYSEEATLARARTTHPHGYLLKPFSERELHATIQMAMERSRADTERQQHMEQLHQSQKLEAIGMLAGGVAHDFNNLLTIIQGNLEIIQEHAGYRDVRNMLGDALKAAQRGAALTQQLLAYSRRQTLAPEVLDLPALVAELKSLLARLLGETIEIQTSMPAQMWKIRADQNQLESALINLAVNARDAMPEGGILSIAGGNSELAQALSFAHGEFAAGRFASLAVSDTGMGMSAEVADKALEPFFTTKPVGKGTGLGLSQVFGFVRQSGGLLQIKSEPGVGTTVQLLFPALDDADSADSAAVELAPAPPVQEEWVVLVVEDDPMVRRSVCMLLASLGYRTLEAEQGLTARDLLAGESAVHVLLTDMVLPKGISGAQLAREARALQPGLKVLFMSGYAAHASEADAAGLEDIEILQKPFSKAALGRKLQALLNPIPDSAGPT